MIPNEQNCFNAVKLGGNVQSQYKIERNNFIFNRFQGCFFYLMAMLFKKNKTF